MVHTLVTSVTGGYNGGALISITLDDESVFSATGNYPYNLQYTSVSGSFEIPDGIVFINVTPPPNSTSLLTIEYSGAYAAVLSIDHLGNNTSWGYNFTQTDEIEDSGGGGGDGIAVTLCNNSSERNEINKTISTGETFFCILRRETSVSDPVIILEYNGNLSGYNYCYIPDFGRYYYITDITSVRNNIWMVKCHVDVLMSFNLEILSSIAILEESSVTGASNYLHNDVWRALSKDKTSIIPFSNGLNSSGEYILITAGG